MVTLFHCLDNCVWTITSDPSDVNNVVFVSVYMHDEQWNIYSALSFSEEFNVKEIYYAPVNGAESCEEIIEDLRTRDLRELMSKLEEDGISQYVVYYMRAVADIFEAYHYGMGIPAP